MKKHRFTVVVGASAGGSVVLPDLLRQFTPEMNIAVFVVMHLTKKAIGDMLVERLQKHTVLKCKIPKHKEVIRSGHIYVARPDHHMMLKGNTILVGKGPMENRYRPSIDALFRSAAAEHSSYVIGIILSGFLEDGAWGMMAIRRSGGTCIIQHPEEAKYPDMPLSVARHLKPDFSISVKDMGRAILSVLSKTRKKSQVPGNVIAEARLAEKVSIGMDNLKELGTHSLYSCPDCGGGLWEIKANGEKNYRCHVGHAYTEVALLGAMETTTETALWTALRIVEERRNLLTRMAAKEKGPGTKSMQGHYKKRAAELEQQIQQIRRVLFLTEQD